MPLTGIWSCVVSHYMQDVLLNRLTSQSTRSEIVCVTLVRQLQSVCMTLGSNCLVISLE